MGWSPYCLESTVLFPRELPTTRAALVGPRVLQGFQISHLFGEIDLCLGRWAMARSLLKLNGLYLNYCPGYHTTSDLFPEYVPLLYEKSHILFLKFYSPLIQFLIIIPYHARCVSVALRKLSLVVNLTPENSQSC